MFFSDLLISVTGGAKSFNVSHDICSSFQQGLLSAAKSTNAWLITGGQNCVSACCPIKFYVGENETDRTGRLPHTPTLIRFINI